MHGLKREGGRVEEMHVAIEATVEAEVAEVGGRAIEVLGVIAEDRERDAVFIGGVRAPGVAAARRASVMSKTNSS